MCACVCVCVCVFVRVSVCVCVCVSIAFKINIVGKINQAFAIEENCNGWGVGVGGWDLLLKCHRESSVPFTGSAFELIDLLCNLIFSLMDAALHGVTFSTLTSPNCASQTYFSTSK